MFRFLVLSLTLLVASVNAQEAPSKPPKPKAGVEGGSAWGRAVGLLRAAYGKPLEDDLAEKLVGSFVAAAARSGQKAPTTGTREEKAAYYLRLIRNVHSETYLREEAQKAADARVEELRPTLPKE